MLQVFKASEWQHYIPQQENGETRNIRLELEPTGSIDIEILSAKPVTLNLISTDGETLYVKSGNHVHVQMKYSGFFALEIVADGLFSYKTRSKLRWYEKLDPTPLAIAADTPAKQPLLDLMRAELAAYMARRDIADELRDEVSVEELMADIESGDLDFEDDVDEFGLSALDMQPVEPVYDDPGTPPPHEPKAPQAPAAAASSTAPAEGSDPV